MNAVRERPVFFPAGPETLFGILTEPDPISSGTTVLLLAGGRFMPSTHRNGLWVRAARQLVARGHAVMRFDYHGVGESGGTVGEWRLDRPFVEDARGAVRWLEGQQLNRLVLVGSCFGGRTALSTAAEVPDLAGVLLFAPAVRDFELGQRHVELTSAASDMKRLRTRHVLRDLRDPALRRRYLRRLRLRVRAAGGRLGSTSPTSSDDEVFLGKVSRHFLDPLSELVLRGVKVLIVYGQDDEDYGEFVRATRGRLGDILERAGELIEVRPVPGKVHGFTSLSVQDLAAETIAEWVDRLAGDRVHTRG